MQAKAIDIQLQKYSDNCTYIFNFKNGLLDLRTGLFRPRTNNDYFTVALNYDYNENYDKDIFDNIEKIILQICNNDAVLAEQYKSWLGYCMTGKTNEQKAMWCIISQQNSKITLIDAFVKMAHIYCVKLNSKTFNKTNQTKPLSMLNHKRMAYIDEFDDKKFDLYEYREYTDQYELVNDNRLIQIHFKLMLISNKIPKFQSDAIVKHRGYCIEHTNVFNNNLNKLFDQDNYKLALFHILRPYATRYYQSGMSEIDMSPLVEAWENVCDRSNIK